MEARNALYVPPYELAQPHVDTHFYELHDVPQSLVREPVFEIVRVEGPVHVSEIVRRIREAAGLARSGRRIQEHLERTIHNSVRSGAIVQKDKFLSLPGVEKPVVRDRSDVAWLRKIELIPPEEIAEAAKMIVESSYGIDRADAATETARLLGFKSVSRFVRTNIDSVIQGLIDTGDLENDNDHLTLH